MKEEREKENSVLRMVKKARHYMDKTVRRYKEIIKAALSKIKSTKDEYSKLMNRTNQTANQKQSNKVSHTSERRTIVIGI